MWPIKLIKVIYHIIKSHLKVCRQLVINNNNIAAEMRIYMNNNNCIINNNTFPISHLCFSSEKLN